MTCSPAVLEILRAPHGSNQIACGVGRRFNLRFAPPDPHHRVDRRLPHLRQAAAGRDIDHAALRG